MDRIFKFWDTACPTDPPVWTTENIVVYEHPAFLLRLFRGGTKPPTLIVPPQAGHSSHIADHDHGQSLVETVIGSRHGPVYCIEWLSAGTDRRCEGIDELVTQLGLVAEYVGPCHLVGLCQGGWLSAIYTALEQRRVLSLTCLGSPIDFHAGGGVIFDTVTAHGIGPYKAVVDMYNGTMPGSMMLAGWKLMHPVERFFGDYIDILNVLDDDDKIRKIKRFRTWYEHTQDLAGTWYLEAVQDLFIDNLLVKGQLKILNQTVNLANITCPIVMVAGENDDITLIPQVYALGDHAGSECQLSLTIPGCGHIGIFCGSKSQPYIASTIEWIDALKTT